MKPTINKARLAKIVARESVLNLILVGSICILLEVPPTAGNMATVVFFSVVGALLYAVFVRRGQVLDWE